MKTNTDKIYKLIMIEMPLLEIKDCEINTLTDYVINKGVFLHKQIYDVILTYSNVCEYKKISSIIRYDKGIRNVLYKYLSAFEEKYRSILFERYDVENPIGNPDKVKIEDLSLINRTSRNSNLYNISYSRYFSLTALRNTLQRYDLIDEKENDDFTEIAKLRNKTMHHNLLMTGYHRNIRDVSKEISRIEVWIQLLYDYLPFGMNKEFEKAINRCNNIGTKTNIPNLDIICLREMRNGVFI